MKKVFDRLILILQEDVIGTGNRVIAMAWLACLVGLIGLGFYLSSESQSFLGVADSRELQVNFEYPVEIKRVHVIPGQAVRKGDLLIELDQSELTGKIRLIRSQLSKLHAELGVRKTLNNLVNNSSDLALTDPLAVDIEDMSNELQYLENQRKNLYVFADVDGIVGGVAFRKGEKVPSFTSLVTLSPKHPTYVEGFLHESLPTRVDVGREVTVYAVSSRLAGAVQGKVVSVGARIILMPARLSFYPNAQVWGREVVVEIPPENAFLLGEKVQIQPNLDLKHFTRAFWPFMDKAQAKDDIKPASVAVKTDGADHDPELFKVPAEISSRFHLEPSGVIYLDDVKKFLFVSDDTDKKKNGVLFLADADGNVGSDVLEISGLGKIDDMESISQSGGWIYVMTSQGASKSGKEKFERGLFVRFKREGLNLHSAQSVHFKPLLLKAIAQSKDMKLRNAFAKFNSAEMEIEGHFVEGKDLFLGFKFPQGEKSEALILPVHDFETLFRGTLDAKQLGASMWVDFGRVQGAPHRLSDLIRINGTLFATTVCKEEGCGAVWKLQRAERNGDRLVAEQLRFYSDLRPEGIAYDAANSVLFVTCDQGKEAAQFNRIPLIAPVQGSQQAAPPKKYAD